jgi:putative glycosyltransferase (TIGR04372 family)
MRLTLFRTKKLLRRAVRRAIRRPIGVVVSALDLAPGKRRLAALLLRTPLRLFAFEVLARLSRPARLRMAAALPREFPGAVSAALVDTALRRARRGRRLGRIDVAVAAALGAQRSPDARRLLDELLVGADARFAARLSPLELDVAFELGDHRAVVDLADVAIRCCWRTVSSRGALLRAAFSAGQAADTSRALWYLKCHYRFANPHFAGLGPVEDAAVDRDFRRKMVMSAIEAASREITIRLLEGHEMRIGLFFLASTQALGHAVLDPYHLLAQARGRFDHMIFIGPPKSWWKPASLTALRLVEEHAVYCETEDEFLLDLSWMQLGEFSFGKATIIVENYWSLLRQSVHRTRDPSDPFRHNDWFLGISPRMRTAGERILRRAGIDPDRPLVVLHARDSGYHGIAKQAFRDAPIASYREAVELLLDRGHQVVRIGDERMPRLPLRRAGYVELPFVREYANFLDPYVISRADFMIGCQSGPCAYARALGVPLLSVNAVLHYTLLPAVREMACFKRYFVAEGGGRREIGLAEALDRGVQFLDNGFQFAQAGVEVQTATPGEISAAVEDMLAWLADPDLPETADQSAFREHVEDHARRLARDGNPRLPIADFVGFCLPGYRISPTVAAMRAPAVRGRHPDVPVAEAVA